MTEIKNDVTNRARDAFMREVTDSIRSAKDIDDYCWFEEETNEYTMRTDTTVWGAYWALRWIADSDELNYDMGAFLNMHCHSVKSLYHHETKESDDV